MRRKQRKKLESIKDSTEFASRDARRKSRDSRSAKRKVLSKKPSLDIPDTQYSLVQSLGILHGVLTWPTDSDFNLFRRQSQLSGLLLEVANNRVLFGSSEEFLNRLFTNFGEVAQAYPKLRSIGFHPTYLRKIISKDARQFAAILGVVEPKVKSVALPTTSEKQLTIHRAGRDAYLNWPESLLDVPGPIMELLERQLVPYPLVTAEILKSITDKITTDANTDLAVSAFVKNVFNNK